VRLLSRKTALGRSQPSFDSLLTLDAVRRPRNGFQVLDVDLCFAAYALAKRSVINAQER